MIYSLKTADRIRRPSNDPFFLNGDILSYDGSTSTLTFFYQDPDSQVKDGEYSYLEDENNHNEEEEEYKSGRYPCAVVDCHKTFSSLHECEIHYQQCHIHECVECGRTFPSNHWLDLHLQEAHDAFFATFVQKQPHTAHYKCLIPDCVRVFHSDAKRLHHLRTHHGFPKWFRFHLKCDQVKGRKSFKHHPKMRNTHHKESKQKNVNTTFQNNENKNVNKMNDNTNSENTRMANNKGPKHLQYDEYKEKQKQKRRGRKERKKEQYSKTPCKFYFAKNKDGTIGNCYRGDACIFSHSIEHTIVQDHNTHYHNNDINDVPPSKPKNAVNMDMDMDDILSSEMKFKMKLSIPAKICFGGKKNDRRA